MSGSILFFLGLAVVVYITVFRPFRQRKINKEKFLQKQREKQFSKSKLVSVLLGLDDRSVKELLKLYRTEFGVGPALYAGRTYKKWKNGDVQPITQTYERFLVHLPKVMSYDLKCEVLRHLMEEYAAKDNYVLSVSTDDWQDKLAPLVTQIIDKAFTAQLPVEVESKLKWLGDGDMQAAQKILRASQVEEGRIMVSMLKDEFSQFKLLMSEENIKPKLTHELKFPYGTILLNIK